MTRRTFTTLGTLTGALCAMLTAAARAALPPEPDAVPRRWQLEFKPGALRYAAVETPETGLQGYFYMTYTTTNLTGNDLLLAPSFELATDAGPVIRAGRDIPAEVTSAILTLLDNPLIQDQISILGTIPHGEENARQGVVIWPARDLDTNEVVVYAQGFSGETRVVENVDPATGKSRPVTLRKTYMVRYSMPGEIGDRGSTPFEPSEQRWILR